MYIKLYIHTYIIYIYIYYIVFIKDKLYSFNLICSIKCKTGDFMSLTRAEKYEKYIYRHVYKTIYTYIYYINILYCIFIKEKLYSF